MYPHSCQMEFTRRGLIFAGAAGALTLGGVLQARLRAEQSKTAAPAAIRSCIFLFYYGGPSHLDTYDLKPQAPSTVRGEFQGISTTVPGLQVCEHLPRMARVMHHCALIRSMHHKNRLHDSASIETHTGRQAAQGDREEFAPIPQFFPCHGATVSYVRRDQNPVVPHAALPYVFHNVVDVPCQGGGFLGANFDPFRISVDPEKQDYTVPELQLREELQTARIRGRSRLLTRLQHNYPGTLSPDPGLAQYYEKALSLLGADAIRRALDLEQEPREVRELYGLHSTAVEDNGFGSQMRGQNLLVARRLVEAGVPFVNVYDYRQQGLNWDSHAQNFEQHKRKLLPPADRALSALITDLDERGLLSTTLVVAAGEFGRTPTINKNAGRDHWPDCYTILLAGGGVRGGAVFGASDATGAYPTRDPVTPADLAATIYWRFGLDPLQHIHDRSARPWPLADGRPVTSLFDSRS